MNDKIVEVMKKFSVYADEVEHGYNGLARIYHWIFGEKFKASSRIEVEVEDVAAGDKCYAPAFYNAAKSIHYMHQMSDKLMHDLIPFMNDSPIEFYALEDEERLLSSLQDVKSRQDVKKKINNRRLRWLETTDKTKKWCGVVFNITSILEHEFVKVANVKYDKPMDTNDVKIYLKNKRMDCEDEK